MIKSIMVSMKYVAIGVLMIGSWYFLMKGMPLVIGMLRGINLLEQEKYDETN